MRYISYLVQCPTHQESEPWGSSWQLRSHRQHWQSEVENYHKSENGFHPKNINSEGKRYR